MRRYFVQIISILCIGILFIGCQSNNNETKENETTTEAEFVFPVEIPVIPDDPEGKLYFTCKNINTDIYMKDSTRPYQQLGILSLEPLELDKIQVSVPVENSYAVYIEEIAYEDLHTTEYLLNQGQPQGSIITTDTEFPYYLYQCYRGTDWKKMKELYDDAEKARQREVELLTGSHTSPEYIAMKETIARYEEYRDLYFEDYKKLTSEDLPVFYAYNVTIYFGFTSSQDENFFKNLKVAEKQVSESFRTIDIKIGDVVYTQNIGEIRLHAESLFEKFPYSADKKHMKNLSDFGAGTVTYPWGDGKTCKVIEKFIAQKDLSIHEIYLYENTSDITVLGAHVSLSDGVGTSQNNSIDFYWDLEEPLSIEKGTCVTIELIIQDTRMQAVEYGARMTVIIAYMVDSNEYNYQIEVSLERIPWLMKGYWLRYASVFDGLEEELQSYFNDYYRPINETWKENSPW